MVGMIFLTFISAISEVSIIALIMPLLDYLQDPLRTDNLLASFVKNSFGRENTLLYMVFLIYLAVGLSSSLRFSLIYAQARFANLISGKLASALIQSYINTTFDVKNEFKSDRIVTLYSIKIPQVIGQLVNPLIMFFTNFSLVIVFVSLLFYTNWRLSLIVVALYLLFYTSVVFSTRTFLNRSSNILNQNSDRSVMYLEESVRGFRDILSYGLVDRFQYSFLESDRKIRDTKAKIDVVKKSPRVLVDALTIIFICLICVFLFRTSSNVPGGASIISTLGAFALASQRLIPGIQQMFVSWSAMKSGYFSVLDVLDTIDLLDAEPNISAKDQVKDVINFRNIKLSKVTHKYEAKPVFSDISFEVNNGDKVLICGPSGSGKSTLLDIIAGIRTPSSGFLEISDEVSLFRSSSVSFVSQHPVLLRGTVIENITCFAEEIDERKLNLLLTDLNIDSNLLNEKRVDLLSGGQRQRVALARALYRDPSILLLDECTSAIEQNTSTNIFHSLLNNRNMTIIAISHDPKIQDLFEKKINLK